MQINIHREGDKFAYLMFVCTPTDKQVTIEGCDKGITVRHPDYDRLINIDFEASDLPLQCLTYVLDKILRDEPFKEGRL